MIDATNAPVGIILAGGKEERIRAHDTREKPLAIVNGAPIVLHVARGLAKAGVRKVIILTGENHARVLEGLGLTPGAETGLLHDCGAPCVNIEVRPSEVKAGTAGRLMGLTKEELQHGALLSYTDILSDAPLEALPRLLHEREAVCAMLAVNPREPWGRLEITDGRVESFEEKRLAKDVWVNGGVLALASDIQDYIHDTREMLEVEVMDRLLEAARVAAYQHEGWWQAVDTQKDLSQANDCGHAAQCLSIDLELQERWVSDDAALERLNPSQKAG